MPDRVDNGRGVVSADRTLAPARNPLGERSTPNAGEAMPQERAVMPAARPMMEARNTPGAIIDRTIQQREAIGERLIGGRNAVSLSPPSDPPNTSNTPNLTPPTFGETFNRQFDNFGSGSGGYRAFDTPIAVIPGGEVSSGGNSSLLILGIVVIVGGVGYYLYTKNKG